jgi:hypothetical protein
MNNFELIDDYLANRLTGGEKEAFESQLGNDPTLKSELEFQKQIVEGIKHARATELKSMLSRVQVGGGAQIEFSVLRIAAGVVLAGVVGAATYYYFKSEESFPPIENAAADVSKKDAAKPEEAKPESTTAPSENKDDKVAAPEKKEKASKEDSSGDIKPAVKPSIELADPSAELAEENRPSVELPESVSRTEIAPSHVQVQMDSSNKKYDFHYQFAGNKLMLYGSFDRSLYEVLEINNQNHALFLFYKNNFYLLEESNKDITKLSAITDQALLKKLREYRSR